jgi:tetratricopeptide (TPR) repeat protein
VATKAKTKAKAKTPAKTTKKAPARKKTAKIAAPEPEAAAPQTLKPAESYRKALEVFEEAFSHLAKKDYEQARQGFRRLLDEHAVEPELCDRARVFLRACDRSTAEPPPPVEDADSHYLQAVLHANRGEFDLALASFDKGLAQAPDSEKLLYVSAVTLAQAGRTVEAMQRLGRAIELNPQNRIFALNDPDFELVRDEPEFIDLVEPEESRGL